MGFLTCIYGRELRHTPVLVPMLLLGMPLAWACGERPETITAIPHANVVPIDATSMGPYGEGTPSASRTNPSVAVAGADILIFGDRAGERAQLAAVLTGLGAVVTNVAPLPGDLSPYDAIFHVGAFAPLTAGEQAALAAFLASGRGVHLTGERPCCEAMNASLQTLINAVVVGGGITVGGLGDFLPQGPFFTFNPGAVGNITTNPNAIVTWSAAAPGGMAGLAAANVLVRHDATGTPNGAVWECSNLAGGDGHLSILMDVNWFDTFWFPDPGRTNVIENVATFLLRSCVIRVDIDIKPGSDPNSINCKEPNGVIPVAILTTASFDATTVNHETVRFEGARESHRNRDGTARRHVEDVDGDGDMDLLFHFRRGDTALTCSSTTGKLTGNLFSGGAIEGSDAVRMVPNN